MKQKFAANISHELRAPLNLILGFSEIMYQTPSVYGEMVWPPRLRQDVSKIYRSSRHLLALIDDILDLTHFEVMGYMLYLESTSISPFLHETADMARDLFRSKPIDFQVDIEENLPVINLDRTRIRQVILNLLNNAQRYTDCGTVRLCAKRKAHEIRVSLEDTGPGIPDDQLVHIFGEFHQADGSLRRKNEGAGLGLAISKRFVEAHSGHIWAESTIGVGSVFSFTLPILDISQPRATMGHVRADVRPLVLAVDANEASCRMLKQHIQDFDVVVVSPGDSLIELTEQYAPRAILINTENGTSRTADDLIRVQIPIIEYSIPCQLWIEYQLPVNGYLVKPVSPQTLMQAVQRFETTHDILIVEDDSNFIHLIERTIQAANFSADLRRAFDGVEALHAMRQKRHDLVLLDVVMPRMDGKQVLEAMQADADLCDIPVVLLTSMTYADNAREYRCRNMVIDRPGGLYPIETLRYLNAVLHEIMPVPTQ
jgi:CheY-like chemotaxis protein